MIRFLDIFLSLTALILLSIPLLIVILCLLVTGEGYVFYRQKRVGKDGKDFRLYKFATMYLDSPNIGTGTVTLKNDPRILPFGRLLRITKINELPQLLNVILGDMSLIGPRPLTRETFNAYKKEDQKTISSVRPGLSGIGSVYFRDEEKYIGEGEGALEKYFNFIAPIKAELECWYVHNKSLKLYILTIFATIISVIWRNDNFLRYFYNDIPKVNMNISSKNLKKDNIE